MVQHLIDLPLKPAADVRHDHDQKLAKAIGDASDRVMRVNAVSGGRVILQDLAGNVYDEPYSRIGNEVLVSGDLVLVAELRSWAPDVSPASMGSTRIVLGRVMTDPAPATIDLVGKMLLNDLSPVGVAGNEIVSFDGTAGAWVHTMNREPRSQVAKQDAADTSSSTASATYQNAMTMSWTLPAGTWSIYAEGWLDVMRASTPSVNLRLTIAGVADSAPSTVSVSTTTMMQKSTLLAVAGVNGGTVTIVLQYKGASGSGILTSAESPRISARAVRTA